MQTTISRLVLSNLIFLSFYLGAFAQSFLTVSNDFQIEQFTGQVVDYVIPYDLGGYDVITFWVSGADGGSAQAGADCKSWGGDGASVYVTCFIGEEANHLPPGTPLRFIVGGGGKIEETGGTDAARGGGGGGSGVLAWLNGQWEIIAVAGGGGGAYQGNIFGSCIDSQSGQGGRASTGGDGGGGDVPGSGGSNGNGGGGGGDIGDGDLSGGGGGAFSNGSGGSCMEGKAGFPVGGDGGCGVSGITGGWGFGGGGGGDESPGGGGGYSGGGGGGLVNNGGGGGSYVNPNFAMSSTITAGGSTEGDYNGAIGYRFRQPCHPTILGVEVTEPICTLGDQATITVYWNETYIGCSKDDYHIVFHSVESNENIAPNVKTPNFIYYNIEAGNYTIQAYDNNGFLYQTEHLSLAVEDNTPPEALCKDATVQLANGTYGGDDLVEQINNGSSDNCGTVSLQADPASFDCSDVGENFVYLYVYDEHDNANLCTATVTVVAPESGGPVAICKPAFTVALADVEVAVPSINNGSYFGDCGPNPIYQTPQHFSCEDLGANIVTLSLTDDAGENSSCTTVVTVVDTNNPSLFCKSDAQITPIVLDENGSASIEYATIVNFAIDICTSASPIGVSPNTFNCSDVGEQIVTASAMDEAGNIGTCVRTVTVQENVALAAICNNLTINLDEVTTKTLTVNQLDGGSNSSCNFTLSASQTTFDCSDVGTNTITLTATGESGNQSSCSATVTVRDVNAPIIICQDLTVSLNMNGSIAIDANTVTSLITDNCSVANTQLLGNASFSCTDIGEQSVTVNVTDNSGEANTCIAHVTIADRTVPDAICQDITIQLDQTGTAAVTTQQINNGSSDNCGINNLSIDQSSFNCGEVGIAQTTLTVTDNSGNTSTCTANITVKDMIDPVALCQDITAQLDENGIAAITSQQVNNGSSDACGIGDLTLDQTNFTCYASSSLVTLTVTDNNGNTSNCSSTVSIVDQIAPSAVCNDITINLIDRNPIHVSSEMMSAILQGSTENCAGWSAGITSGATSYSCADINNNFILTLTLTDASNNSSTCTTTVTVTDPNSVCNDPPVAVCQDITVSVDGNCEALVNADALDGESSDPDNDPLTFTMNHEPQFALGTHTVTLEVSDGEYTSSCTATITAEDDTPPTLTCSEDLNLNTDTGTCSSTFTVPEPEVADNCKISVLRHRYRLVNETGNNIANENWSSWSTATTESLGIGNWKMQWQAKDPSGNQSKCTFYVEVIDAEAPVPFCLSPIVTFNGEGNIGLSMSDIWDENASSDNCSGVFFVDQSITEVTCDQLGDTIPVTVTVEDENGNTGTCTANVFVDGLPCSWSIDPNGVNCDPGEASYDLETTFYNLTSEGCYHSDHYRLEDTKGFIQQSLCGDGEIIAQITDVIGNGWAGISMRESNDPSAPMIQLMIDGTSMSRRELRQIVGSYAFAHMYPTQGKNWLRLSRSGNQFTASRSSDGVTWEHVFITQILMSNCIEIGLITMNGAVSGEVIGTFANVSIGSSSALAAPASVDIAQPEQPQVDFTLFPNPAAEVVNLQFGDFDGKPVQARIYNHLGQNVKQFQWEDADYSTRQIRINDLQAGTYIVEIENGTTRMTKKLVVTAF